MVTLLLGVAFLFKYGVDNDWFGPGVRVALGIVAAMISLFAGDRLWRRGQTVFAQGIIGLGLALLYLSIYAAAMLYHLLPQSLAFVAMCGVTAGAGWLALLYNSQAVAVIAMIGGYLTPPALSTGEDHPWILFGYVFLLNVGGSAAGTKAAMEGARADRRRGDDSPLRSLVLPHGLAMRIVPWPPCLRSPFTRNSASPRLSELWALFQLGASIALALDLARSSSFVWWNLAMVAGGLATAYRRSWATAPIWTLGCFWLPVWLWYSPDVSFAAISAAFLIFFGWTLWRGPERAPGFGLIAANAAIYYAASYTLLNPAHHQYMGLLAAAVGGIHLLLARHFEARQMPDPDTRGCACVRHARRSHPVRRIPHHHRLGAGRSGPGMAVRPLPQPVAARRFLVRADAGAGTPVRPRYLYLLAEFRVRHASEHAFPDLRRLDRRPLAGGSIPGSGGRCRCELYPRARVLLFGLGLEIGGWVSRNVVPENQSSVQIVAISVMLTVYAVILVLIGVKRRRPSTACWGSRWSCWWWRNCTWWMYGCWDACSASPLFWLWARFCWRSRIFIRGCGRCWIAF